MVLILTQHDKDTPAVQTELVFFLSMNTSVETIDNYMEQTADFKFTINDFLISRSGQKGGI